MTEEKEEGNCYMRRDANPSYLNYAMIYFFYFFALSIFGSMLSVYLTSIGKSASDVAWIISGSGLCSMVFGPIMGIAYDRTGKRKTFSMILLALAAITGVGFTFANDTLLLFLLYGFCMAFMNAVNPICEQIAADAPYRYGVLRLWGAIGYAIGTQIAGMMLDNVPTFWMFATFALSALLTGAFFHQTGLCDISVHQQAEMDPQRKINMGIPLILFALYCFLFSGITSASGAYVPLFLSDKLQSTSMAGTVLFLGTLMEIPLIFLSDRFMDRLQGRKLLILNVALLILQLFAYSFLENTVFIAIVLFFTKSVTTMLAIMVTLKVTMILTKGQYVTTTMSILATVKSLGGVVFTNIAGKVVDANGMTAMFRMLLVLSVVTLLIGFVINIPMTERQWFTQNGHENNGY